MDGPVTVPFFSIDVDRLKSFLADGEGRGLFLDARTPRASPVNVQFALAGEPKLLAKAVAPQFQRRPRSSTFAAPADGNLEGSPRWRFLMESELQVRKLFHFVEQHLDKAERDLSVQLNMQIRSTTATRPRSNSSIQLEDREDSFEPKGLGLTRAHASRLRHLQDVLVSLKVSLQSGFEALERLTREYDRTSTALANIDGEAFLNAKKWRRAELDARIAVCLNKTNSWLQGFSNKLEEGNQTHRFTVCNHLTCIKREKADYMTGPYIMLFLALCTVSLYMYFWDSVHYIWVIFFRMIRSPLLIVLYLFLLALNMEIWAQSRIDYISIFGFPFRGIPTPKYLIEVAGLFTMIFALMVSSFLVLSPFTYILPCKLIPLVMWILLLLFLINPLNGCLMQGRKAFISSLLRIIASPLTEGCFGEVWLAIQLNSLGVVLLDLEYTLCYVVQGPWSGAMDPRICTGSENAIRPLIASLPAIVQVLQNLRLFADKRRWKFIAIVVKHTTSFPIIIFATLFSIELSVNESFSFDQIIGEVKFEWLGGMWLLFALVNGVYTFSWDMYNDWGLWNLSRCTLLRPTLLYRWKIIYFMAMLLDLFFRSFWALEITLALVWRYNSYTDLIYTGLVVGEIIRCFVWNFFRLEHQQVQRMFIRR